MTDPAVHHPLYSPGRALLVLAAAACGFAASDGPGAGSGAHTLVSAITPEQAQQWVAVVVSAANELFKLFNVAVGIWQGVALARHHRRRRRESRPKGDGDPFPDTSPHGGSRPISAPVPPAGAGSAASDQHR